MSCTYVLPDQCLCDTTVTLSGLSATTNYEVVMTNVVHDIGYELTGQSNGDGNLTLTFPSNTRFKNATYTFIATDVSAEIAIQEDFTIYGKDYQYIQITLIECL